MDSNSELEKCKMANSNEVITILVGLGRAVRKTINVG